MPLDIGDLFRAILDADFDGPERKRNRVIFYIAIVIMSIVFFFLFPLILPIRSLESFVEYGLFIFLCIISAYLFIGCIIVFSMLFIWLIKKLFK